MTMTNSNKSKRIVNFIIDFGVIVIVSSLIYVFTSNSIATGIIIWIIFLLYYILMEAITGKTLGKRITKTRVVNLSGSKPKPGLILIRTFLRCNPFDAVSYLFGNVHGTHDLLSKTKVVDD